MSLLTLVGVDPGLVHTGVVVLRVDTLARAMAVEHFVIEGDDHASQVAELLDDLAYVPTEMFIEAYRERGQSYGTNPQMRELMAELRRRFPRSRVIDNTGVKKVVTPRQLEVFGLTDFPTTHHQDLQSAARILLYGMFKDEDLNRVVYDIVADYADGRAWPVERV